ncbi:MAG: HAMP domain-containing sensor histidine kinase [Roseobacter sp.]
MKKWRPGLAFVLGGALCGTLGMSLICLVAYRYAAPEIGFREAAILFGMVITTVTAVLGWLLVRLLLRPILDLQRYANRARKNDASDTMKPTHFGTRELQTTAMSVIEMADTLQNRETTVRNFSDHVSHELKTPVSVIRAATELLQDSEDLTQDHVKLVEQIVSANNQMETHLHAMRKVVQAREVQHSGSTRLQNLTETLHAQFPNLELKISGGDVSIPLARTGLEIVLSQLLSNSQAHQASIVKIDVHDGESSVSICVTDDGCGISAGNAKRMFDPFFTTRRAQGGTGMGLSITLSLLRANGGVIRSIERSSGAKFRIDFRST